MENSSAFTYNYSASANKEVLEIRKRYMPREESKLDELKRLDGSVQSAGVMEALVVGVLGCLVFGMAMCMGLDVMGGGMALAILLGIAGAAGMIAAWPIHRIRAEKAKRELTPRILKLADELSGKSSED